MTKAAVIWILVLAACAWLVAIGASAVAFGMIMGGCKTVDAVREYVPALQGDTGQPDEPEAPDEPAMTSDQFLDRIKAAARLETNTKKTPDITDNVFTFSDGTVVKFYTQNAGGNEHWDPRGQIIRPDGRTEALNANITLRHGVFAVITEARARYVGQHQAAPGVPEVRPFDYVSAYSWTTLDNTPMIEVDGVNLYCIRVVAACRAVLGIDADIVRVSGTIRRYR